MFSHTVTATQGQARHIELPGGRTLRLESDGKLDAPFRDGFVPAMITDLEDERLKEYARTGASGQLGEGWTQGWQGFLHSTVYLPSTANRLKDCNPYVAANQVIQASWREGAPHLRVTTNLFHHDGQVYDHTLEGTLNEQTGAWSDVKEHLHLTVGDDQQVIVDGQRMGWNLA